MTADLFEFSLVKKRFAVIGNPVAHSKSPEIHQIFAQQCNIVLDYQAIHVDHGGFAQALRNLQARGFAGINITVPYKQNAAEQVDSISKRARVANAVNTIKFEDDGSMYGDNTDGEGLLRDLEKNLCQSICDSKILVVGAGGAARGILEPILAAKPEMVAITNRTAKRGISISNEFLQYGPVSWQSFDQVSELSFDIVVNATSASLTGDIPNLPNQIFAPGSLAYDMGYGEQSTPFIIWAKKQGAARTANGLGMLVEQAASSFKLWHQVEPDTGAALLAICPNRMQS
ncbi:MAG: shikimate dehydrogenase [Acidiferrobacteraceae bacterium]|nr:shikimate dehydrogenase [Acidiferrobacteraceae bacterium]